MSQRTTEHAQAAAAAAAPAASAGSKRKSRAADHALAADVAVSSPAAASAVVQSSAEDQPAAASAFPSAAAPNAHLSSAAASPSSASNAHLSSVLESPSASAPVAKRTRRAAQSAAAAVAQAQSSPMMRLLGTDSGARQSLLQMMDLRSIARLQCTGRSWRGWIAAAPFIGARTIDIMGDQSNNPSRCPWIRRSVHHLQYDDDSGDSSDDGEDSQGSDDDVLPAVPFDQLLLLQWSRLRSLKTTLEEPLPRVELLQASFAAVASTLQRLDVSLWEHAPPTASNLLTAISSLHQLESLTIETRDLLDLDLSVLPALPRLQRLTLYGIAQRPCSPAQVEALAQCKSLTDLQCGQWLPEGPLFARSAVQLNADQLQQLEDGLGRLFRLRQDNGAAPLRRLYFGYKPMILPPCWRVLSQFTTLEELDAHWSCTLTADDWMLLANFPRLHTLRINTLERENSRALLDLGLVLPALLRCRALRTLELIGDLHDALELRTEPAALLAQLPSLESFHGGCLRIESLEPLSHAPSLTELHFVWCVGLNDEPINIRAMIPAMPLVRKLTITDHWLSRLTAEQAEPFNVALFARLPRLTPDRFSQE